VIRFGSQEIADCSRGAAELNTEHVFRPLGLVLCNRTDPMAHAMGYRSFAAPRLVEADLRPIYRHDRLYKHLAALRLGIDSKLVLP